MPDVAENPNFEAIIALGNIANVSGFPLSASHDVWVFPETDKSLIGSVGFALEALDVSSYDLLGDVGFALETIEVSNYPLLGSVSYGEVDSSFDMLTPVVLMVVPDNGGVPLTNPTIQVAVPNPTPGDPPIYVSVPVGEDGNIKVWDGAEWIARPLKVWSGMEWEAVA